MLINHHESKDYISFNMTAVLSLDIMKVHMCFVLLNLAIAFVKGDYCDCKLSVGQQQSSYSSFSERLDSEEELLDSLEKRFKRLQDNNAFTLQRLGSSKSTTESLAETVYKLADTCREGHLRCLESGECIHALLGCDGILDCLDGSDEDPFSCINPWKPGIVTECIVPVGQTCFPDGGDVRLIGHIKKVVDSKWFPQVAKLQGEIQYFFNKTDGTQKTDAVNLYATYFTASGKFYTKWGNDEYDFKVEAETAYYYGSTRSYARIYNGANHKNLCGGCYFMPGNA
ncbi:unnamed protein product [Owenia fusiformis]|uniref:Uncharacterized protein n=1 Tax=Owenia fusiformis TaxID=6347 RepID=A0A8J1TFW4_OWEFU|nr:unnamed protein product [Owenia fusiformis]